MKLYAHYLSSSTERVRIGLAIKNLTVDSISVREMGWEEYSDINKFGLVPALEVEGDLIPQSNAILHYLEERYPDPPLLPGNPVLRALSRAFAQAIVCEMHAVDTTSTRKFLREKLKVENAQLAVWSNHWFTAGFTGLENMLRARETKFAFCYGDSPGWADLHLIPHVRKGLSRFDQDMSDFPLIAEIYERCVVLPEFVAASPERQADYPGELVDPATEI